MESRKTKILILLAAMMATVVGCSSAPKAPVQSEASAIVGLQVEIESNDIDIAAVMPRASRYIPAAEKGRSLRYEYVDSRGRRLVTGRVLDPRRFVTAGADGMAKSHGTGIGIAEIQVPRVSGTLRVFSGEAATSAILGQTSVDMTAALRSQAAATGRSSARLVSAGAFPRNGTWLTSNPRMLCSGSASTNCFDASKSGRVVIIGDGFTTPAAIANFQSFARAFATSFQTDAKFKNYDLWRMDIDPSVYGIAGVGGPTRTAFGLKRNGSQMSLLNSSAYVALTAQIKRSLSAQYVIVIANTGYIENVSTTPNGIASGHWPGDSIILSYQGTSVSGHVALVKSYFENTRVTTNPNTTGGATCTPATIAAGTCRPTTTPGGSIPGGSPPGGTRTTTPGGTTIPGGNGFPTVDEDCYDENGDYDATIEGCEEDEESEECDPATDEDCETEEEEECIDNDGDPCLTPDVESTICYPGLEDCDDDSEECIDNDGDPCLTPDVESTICYPELEDCELTDDSSECDPEFFECDYDDDNDDEGEWDETGDYCDAEGSGEDCYDFDGDGDSDDTEYGVGDDDEDYWGDDYGDDDFSGDDWDSDDSEFSDDEEYDWDGYDEDGGYGDDEYYGDDEDF